MIRKVKQVNIKEELVKAGIDKSKVDSALKIAEEQFRMNGTKIKK